MVDADLCCKALDCSSREAVKSRVRCEPPHRRTLESAARCLTASPFWTAGCRARWAMVDPALSSGALDRGCGDSAGPPLRCERPRPETSEFAAGCGAADPFEDAPC